MLMHHWLVHTFIIYAVIIMTAIYLLHFAQVQRIFVMCPELHESHVGALRELRNTLNGWKESKNRLQRC